MSNNGKRVAWVTGGGSGIGEAGAEALAADGWTVVVSGRRQDALDSVVAKIAGSGGKAEAIPLDVSVAADVEKAAGQILARHGRIDLLVNSAGINVPKRSWADMELEGWNKLVDIISTASCTACGRCCRRCASNRTAASSTSRPGPAVMCRRCRGPGLHHDQARGAGADPFLQHGRMRQRPARLLPVTRRGRHPDPQIAPVVPSEQEQARMLQPEDCGRTIAFVASMPPRVCINEILISPTWNRGFHPDAE